jgi:hypothetical protein
VIAGVVILAMAGALVGVVAVDDSPPQPCGEPREATVAVRRGLEAPEMPGTYRLVRPPLDDGRVAEISTAFGHTAVPRPTPTGWEGEFEFGEQLEIERLLFGWYVDTDMAPEAAASLRMGVARPGSKQSAPVLAERALALLGVSVDGWNVSVEDIPDPVLPERTVRYTRPIDGIDLGAYGPLVWEVEVGDDGNVVFVHGTLVDVVPERALPLLSPRAALADFGRLDDRSATLELGFLPVSEGGRKPGVVDAIPRVPPTEFRCGGSYSTPVEGISQATGRVLTDDEAGFVPYRSVEYTVDGVDPALVVVLATDRSEDVWLVPGYRLAARFETSDGESGRPWIGPQLAISPRDLGPH